MWSFFLNPWTMVAGAGLVSAPILIHLINRMRFRRIEWAAMEFLLKAQKKMRRRKVLEELLLLFLRMTLVFLLGVLFARFVGAYTLGLLLLSLIGLGLIAIIFLVLIHPRLSILLRLLFIFLGFLLLAVDVGGIVLIAYGLPRETLREGKETRPTIHVIVLDDTPSMADIGQSGDAFAEAKKLITDGILPAAAQANTPQRVRIVRLSDGVDLVNSDMSGDPELINANSIETIKGQLGGEQTTVVHVSPSVGLARARELLDKSPGETAKFVHFISDFRSTDWSEDAEKISQEIKELTETSGAKVHLIDVASPYRKDYQKTPPFNDNVAIVEFKPRNKLVAQNRTVDFEIRVKNFGGTDLKDLEILFFRNGEGNAITNLRIATLPANQEYKGLIQADFPQVADDGQDDPDPLKRFSIVTALLSKTGSDSLASDNIRHAVVEVKKKLRVLFVVNPDDKADDPNGDSFYLRRLFTTNFAAIEPETGDAESLVKNDLRQYSTIFLLNVPELKKAQAENLERFIAGGGGVGVFLGPKVNAEKYNDELYRGGTGFFPVPLPASGYTQASTDEVKYARSRTFRKRILFKSEAAKAHPAVLGVYTDAHGTPLKDEDAKIIDNSFMLPGLVLDQHWPIARLGKWREDSSVREILCLPNYQPMKNYEKEAFELCKDIKSKESEAKFEKYRPFVDPLLTRIRDFSSSDLPLTELAAQLDLLLLDQINAVDAADALLREFWTQPELSELKKQAQALRDSCKFGDPLYFAKRFGNGRVTLMTIPVGSPWGNWPKVENCWVPVFAEMQKYLSGGGSEENRTVGSTLSLPFEAGRYKPSANWVFLTTEMPKSGTEPQKLEVIREPKTGLDAKSVPLETQDGALRLQFNDTRRPGIYLFALSWLKREGDPASAPSEKPEYFAEAFNIDAEREGNLQRTNADEFKSTAKGAELHSIEDLAWLESLKQKSTDLSSGRWLYLLLLLTLICEQALAVRLSYHTNPENLEAYAPSAAAVFARGKGRASSKEARAVLGTTPEAEVSA